MLSGLCDTCLYKVVIKNDRANEFLVCALSRQDKNFPRYPQLPVIACSGYTAIEVSDEADEDRDPDDGAKHD